MTDIRKYISNLAETLAKDLTPESLDRYIIECQRIADNEIRMGRSSLKYERFVEAGVLARTLMIKKGEL